MTDSILSFAPLVPWSLLAILALASALVVLPELLARARGGVWRLFLLAGLLFTLAHPVVIEETGVALPDQALVIIDRSPSMTIGGRQAQADQALAQVRQAFGSDPSLNLKEVEIGNGANSYGNIGTELFAPLAAAISAIPRDQFAGAVIISDGLIHDRRDTVGLAGLPGPIHGLIVGDRGVPDRRLILDVAPEFALVDRPFDIAVRVEDSDRSSSSRRVNIVVRQDGREVFRRQIRTGMAWPISLRAERRGPMLVEIEVEPLAGEISLRNNRAILSINGVRDRMRVLLVSGEPHPGERVWRAVLNSDPAVDLIHFTILKLPTSQDPTPVNELALIPFPTEELFDIQLDRFDLVIFDRYTLRGVLLMRYLENLSNYVLAGGAILVSTGPEFSAPFSLSTTPLARILPATPLGPMIAQGFRPMPTEIGRRHPVIAGLAGGGAPTWGRWFRQVGAQVLTGDTLMSGASDMPLLVLSRVGEGRVAQLLSDHVWMWARGIEGGGPHAEFLRRIVHWLMKEPDLEEEALVAWAEDGQLVVEQRSLTRDGGSVVITDPDGAEVEVELSSRGDGRSTARVALTGPGLYRVSDGNREIFAGAGELNPREFAELVPTRDRLAALAEETGGSVRWLEDGMPRLNRVADSANMWGRDWIAFPRRGARKIQEVTEGPLLPGWLALIFLLSMAVIAWWRESR